MIEMETEPSLEQELDALERIDDSAESRLGRGRRLHPTSPLFEIGRSFLSLVVPGLIVLFLAAGDRYEIWYMAFFVPSVASSVLRYFSRRYLLTGEHLVVREGIFFRKTRNIPYARIQNIDTIQNPLHRLFGVVEVRLETASGQEPEAVFRVLSLAALDEIRDGVFARRRIPEPRSPEPSVAPETTGAEARADVFRMRPIDVAYFGFLSQKGIALLFGLMFLVWEFDLWKRLLAALPFDPEELPSRFSFWTWLMAAFGLFLALQALTLAWAFVTLFDFHVARVKEDLRTTCGLWTRQTATLPRQRIQFLEIQEGWLQRRLGRMSVKALTAGGDSTSRSQVSRKWLVPVASVARLSGILEEVQPEVSFEGRSWERVHPRAVRRLFVRWVLLLAIPVGFVARTSIPWACAASVAAAWIALSCSRSRVKRLGFSLGDTAVYMRDGVLTHVRKVVRFSKIQSVALTRSPFDVRHGMATVRVDTAGNDESELSFVLPFLRLRDAVRLARLLRRRAAETSFTW